MQLCGSGIVLSEAAARLPRPPPPGVQRPALTAASEETKRGKAAGVLSLDPEVHFSVTAVGKSETEKVRMVVVTNLSKRRCVQYILILVVLRTVGSLYTTGILLIILQWRLTAGESIYMYI
jgi:hypothetical protein